MFASAVSMRSKRGSQAEWPEGRPGKPKGRSLVFMEDNWSQCPVNLWVPAMVEGVWSRACVLKKSIAGHGD
jgi:hypothetical protein